MEESDYSTKVLTLFFFSLQSLFSQIIHLASVDIIKAVTDYACKFLRNWCCQDLLYFWVLYHRYKENQAEKNKTKDRTSDKPLLVPFKSRNTFIRQYLYHILGYLYTSLSMWKYIHNTELQSFESKSAYTRHHHS